MSNEDIEDAIKSTLVIENPQSINYTVDKLNKLLDIARKDTAIAFGEWLIENMTYQRIEKQYNEFLKQTQ